MEKKHETITARLGVATVARIDALAKRLSTRAHKVTRAEVLRSILASGLEKLEAERMASQATEEEGKRR